NLARLKSRRSRVAASNRQGDGGQRHGYGDQFSGSAAHRARAKVDRGQVRISGRHHPSGHPHRTIRRDADGGPRARSEHSTSPSSPSSDPSLTPPPYPPLPPSLPPAL